jgi:hypothetical protein
VHETALDDGVARVGLARVEDRRAEASGAMR